MAADKHLTDPVDAVITWVDGSDPVLTEKRTRYLQGAGPLARRSAHPTRFASVNEIRYCILSILRYAPFVRNLYIVTDGQDPKLIDEIETYFPGRSASVRIVDHSEIFEGFEQYLPTFNSISIGNMVWRIKGLSENFIYFNDDVFLTRLVDITDLIVDGRPVIGARLAVPPYLKMFINAIRREVRSLVRRKGEYRPKFSFCLAQWNVARFLGFRFWFLVSGHTPHVMNRNTFAEFYLARPDLLKANISYRFRSPNQFIVSALANHLEYQHGNRNVTRRNFGYIASSFCSRQKMDREMRRCKNDSRIKSVCVQSLDMAAVDEQKRILRWIEGMLSLDHNSSRHE